MVGAGGPAGRVVGGGRFAAVVDSARWSAGVGLGGVTRAGIAPRVVEPVVVGAGVGERPAVGGRAGGGQACAEVIFSATRLRIQLVVLSA